MLIDAVNAWAGKIEGPGKVMWSREDDVQHDLAEGRVGGVAVGFPVGRVEVEGRRFEFGPHNQAFGCLDYGRGIWPRRTVWTSVLPPDEAT